MEWQRNVRARRRSEAARGRETPTEAHDGTQDEAEAAAGSLRQQQQQQPQAQQCSDHQSDSRIDDLVQYVQEARDASAGRVLSEDMVYVEDQSSSDNEVQQQQQQQQQQQPQAQQCSDHQSDSRIDDLVQYVQEARDASAGRVLSEDMVYCSSDNDEDDCSSDNEVQQQQQQQPVAAAAAAATAAPTAAATAAGDKP